MRPPFRYFGGKGRLAPWIVSLLPEHNTYVEPFAGSAAVLFAKPQTRNEVLNDAHGRLVNFMKVLRDQPDELVASLRLTPYARQEFHDCKADEGDAVERARRYFVRVSQSVAATARNDTGWSASVIKGANRASTTSAIVERLGLLAERLRCVVVDNRSAIHAIELYARTPETAVYCDPPYLAATRGTTNGYAVEMMAEADHIALSEALHATTAVVLISGYPSELYDNIYDGWWRVERDVKSQIAPPGRNEDLGVSRNRTEVIWSNRPIGDGRLPL